MSSVKVSPGRTVLVVLAVLWGMVGVSGPVTTAEAGEPVLEQGLHPTGGTVTIEGLGRLLTPDPIQPNTPGTQGWNLYSYVANNPTTWTDPTGHVALIEYSIRGATAGAVLGGGIGLFVCDDTALFDVSFGDSYPGCVFRSALAGTAGGAFTVTGGGLWAALGTGAVGGFSSGFVFQSTGALLGNQRFDPGAVLADTIIGAVTGGVLWGGGRLFQTLTNHPTITPNTTDDLAEVGFRSDTSHIFRDAPGHLAADTAEYRALIQKALSPENLRTTITLPDGSTLSQYFKTLPDGTQVWAEVRNGLEITNGGINVIPR